jgi:hypothetical protein
MICAEVDFHRRERRGRRGKIKIKNLSVLCALGGKNVEPALSLPYFL